VSGTLICCIRVVTDAAAWLSIWPNRAPVQALFQFAPCDIFSFSAPEEMILLLDEG